MWTPIPDEKTRVEYIARAIKIYDNNGQSLTVELANKEAERLYHFDHDDWLSEAKEQREYNYFINQ